MYKIVKERRAWWPVTFNGVTENGRVVENKIEMRFALLGEDEHAQFLAECNGLPAKAEEMLKEEIGEEEITPELLAERKPTVLSRLYALVLPKIASDWRGVAAENGEPLKFEPENIQQLMNVPGVFKAALQAYGKCRLGEKDVRSGN